MVDLDTFVTWLYVSADDYCKAFLPSDCHPGPVATLSRSEVVTLAILGQWSRFRSESVFWAEVQRRLGAAFPCLPDRSQFNRLVRHYRDAITAFALFLGDQNPVYEVLDSLGARTRNAQRRGRGWLPAQAAKGRCTRLGWYVGFHVLTVVSPQGAITGFGFAPANVDDRDLADTLLAARACSHPQLPSAGRQHHDLYLADGGFWAPERQARWYQRGVVILAPPQPKTRWYDTWSAWARHWLASHRQIVETVHERLLGPFRLETERPHTVEGFAARLAAKVGLHNFCLWLNRQLGRPGLAVADLIDW